MKLIKTIKYKNTEYSQFYIIPLLRSLNFPVWLGNIEAENKQNKLGKYN